ncbi:MAG: hypothetical protein GX303_00750 [Clostridiales bacterium]|nr:hypothetical protein [Clostridiales bacterium]
MTRKKALIFAINMLSEQPQTREVIKAQKKLDEVIRNLPLANWSEETIFDTINQWVEDNGRVPTTADLQRKGLPPLPSIRIRFKMSGKDFLEKYYPRNLLCDSNTYGFNTKEFWMENFICQYNKISSQTAAEYNKLRDKATPTWGTVARLFGITRWNEWLKLCNIEKPKREKTKRTKMEFSVKREFHFIKY